MPSLRQAVLGAFQDLVHQGRQFTGKRTCLERLSYLPKVTQSGRAEIGLFRPLGWFCVPHLHGCRSSHL